MACCFLTSSPRTHLKVGPAADAVEDVVFVAKPMGVTQGLKFAMICSWSLGPPFSVAAFLCHSLAPVPFFVRAILQRAGARQRSEGTVDSFFSTASCPPARTPPGVFLMCAPMRAPMRPPITHQASPLLVRTE